MTYQTLPEVAENLGVPYATLYYHLTTGKFPAAKEVVNGRQLFTVEEIEVIRDYLAKKPTRMKHKN